MAKDFVALSKKWFDGQASVYDEKDEVLYSKYGKISCRNIADYLKGYNFQNLLDIGCGTGYLLQMLSKEHEAQYTGLDLSEKMIEQAKSKNIRNAQFVEGRSDALPFKDQSFDVVTCSQSFHHYPDTDDALQEARRVLKDNGLYILSDTGVGPFRMFGVYLDDFMYRTFLNTGDCNVSYLEKMVKDLQRNGFEILYRKKVTSFIYTIAARKLVEKDG